MRRWSALPYTFMTKSSCFSTCMLVSLLDEPYLGKLSEDLARIGGRRFAIDLVLRADAVDHPVQRRVSIERRPYCDGGLIESKDGVEVADVAAHGHEHGLVGD